MNTVLTDEQIKDATDYDVLCCDGCYKITENMTTAEADIYCHNCTLKAVAKSQDAHTRSELAKVVRAILNPYAFAGKAFDGYELQYNAVESTRNAVLKVLEGTK